MTNAKGRTSGISVVELLIVIAVMGMLLAVVVSFFSMQVRTTSRTQAGSEVEVKVRTAAEVVMQDLQMAGSRMVVDTSGLTASPPRPPAARYVSEIDIHCSPLLTSTQHCVTVDGNRVTIFYASSLRPDAEACRRVDYELEATTSTLKRSEVPCAPSAATNNSLLLPFALNIDTFTLAFACEDKRTSSDPEDCYQAPIGGDASFPFQATVTIQGRSENRREDRESLVTLKTTMPNLRPVAVSH